MVAGTAALENFYNRITAATGLDVCTVQAEYDALLQTERQKSDRNNLREAKRPWKKLVDEIGPVLRFAYAQKMTSRRVRFPLDDQPPDCWLWREDNWDPVGIEVTIALGRERIQIVKHLVKHGSARGFLGLQDDSKQLAFDEALSPISVRSCHHSAESTASIKKGISACFTKKNKAKFDGMMLLVEAPLGSLSKHLRAQAVQGLEAHAESLPFAEVWVSGGTDCSDWEVFQLK